MKKSHNIASHWHRPVLALLLCAGSASGGEYAILTNGFRLHAERHETVANRIQLFENGGMTEFAAVEIAGFEKEEVTAPVLIAHVTPPPVLVPEFIVKTETAQGDLYAQAARRHGLPAALVRSIVKAESNGNARAISPKGAIGLMQLMPGTARQLGVDPNIPEQNVDAGTRYLKFLLARYEADEDQVARAVAAYNAGPGAVDKYKGVPPYRETQTYVRRVLDQYLKTK